MSERGATAHGAGAIAVQLGVSRHAAERFVTRVRPGLPLDSGARELARLAAFGRLQRQAPDWLRTQRSPAFYLMLTPDIAIPMDMASNGSTYYARTVLTKPIARSRIRHQQRRRARRERRAKRETRAGSLSRSTVIVAGAATSTANVVDRNNGND